MKVKLAMQVLSKSVAIVLRESERKEILATADFCDMMNFFFDYTNVRSKNEYRAKMFLSTQTYNSLKISVLSHVEAVKFLLKQGFQLVLTERSMQNVLEDCFAHQRARGGQLDNPTPQ